MATKQTKPASKPAKGAKPSGSAKTAQKTPAKPASKAKPAAAVKTSAKAAKPSAKAAKPVAKSPAKPAPKKGAPASPKTAAKGKTGASKTTPKLPVRVLAKSATKPPVLESRGKSAAKPVKATGKSVAKSPAKPTPKKATPSVKTPPVKAAPAKATPVKATKPVKASAKPVKPASKGVPAKSATTAKSATASKPAPSKVVAKSAPTKSAKSAKPAPSASNEAAEAKPGNMAREAAERARDRAAARTPTPASAPAPTPAPAPTKAPPPAPSGPAPVAASDYGPGPRKSYIPNVDRPTGMYGGVLLCPDPKPFPRKSPYTKSEIDTLRRALRVEQDRLRRELTSMENMTIGVGDGTATNENAGHSLHIAEFASDMQATETLLGVRRMEEERLAHVEEALQRIEKSENYGLCVACGAKIGIERLVAKPHAHLCLDCRRGYEKARRM